jgi:tetratricopeptide (TPR) repeat protein
LGFVGFCLCLASSAAADAPDRTADCLDLKNLSPPSRIDTCQSLLASGTLTQDETRKAMHGLGVAYAQKGDFTVAITTFTKILSTYPDDAEDYLSRGAAYLATGKKDLGLADYDRAVALQPKHSYLLRANAYFHLGKYDLALADCDAELKLDPADDVAKKLRDQVQAHLDGL